MNEPDARTRAYNWLLNAHKRWSGQRERLKSLLNGGPVPLSLGSFLEGLSRQQVQHEQVAEAADDLLHSRPKQGRSAIADTTLIAGLQLSALVLNWRRGGAQLATQLRNILSDPSSAHLIRYLAKKRAPAEAGTKRSQLRAELARAVLALPDGSGTKEGFRKIVEELKTAKASKVQPAGGSVRDPVNHQAGLLLIGWLVLCGETSTKRGWSPDPDLMTRILRKTLTGKDGNFVPESAYLMPLASFVAAFLQELLCRFPDGLPRRLPASDGRSHQRRVEQSEAPGPLSVLLPRKFAKRAKKVAVNIGAAGEKLSITGTQASFLLALAKDRKAVADTRTVERGSQSSLALIERAPMLAMYIKRVALRSKSSTGREKPARKATYTCSDELDIATA